MSSDYFLGGPRAPERNPPIHPEYYSPSLFAITAIVLGVNTTITTNYDHNYVIGQLVRLIVPNYYGTYQLNEREGYVISIPALDEVVVNIDSTKMNAFIASPSYGPTLPQIKAIGDVNSGQINLGRSNNLTFIPGSFIDISPLGTPNKMVY